jgi:Protein of unknown function (DUF3300)
MQGFIHRPSLRGTIFLTALATLFAVSGSGCKKGSAPPAPAAQTQTPAPTQPTSPAPATTPMALDDLVAPIALYPDQLLGQMLVASTNPQEVLDLGNWLIQNQSLKSDQAPTAAKNAGFSTSAQYLAAFPQVVDNMCQEMDWTTQLGEAFKANQQGVLDAIQLKRTQAKQQGNLQSSPQMAVETKQDNGKEVIQIAPADPQVVYVPQYNTTTIYNEPAPAATTTTTTPEASASSGVSTGAAIGIGLLSFGIGMAVGSSMHDDYYPYPSYGYGGMYYGGRPYYPPPYRAPVYAGYRPAGAYHPPSNYQWNQYNRNVNVKVNNNNYYGKYQNNANRPGGANNSYLGANNNRPGANTNNRPNSPGQSGYLGAHPQQNRNERPGASMADANPGAANRGNLASNRPETNPNVGNANRANVGNAGGAARPASANRPTSGGTAGGSNRQAGGGDRGFSNGGAQPNRSAENRTSSGGAFGNANSNAKSDRAASSRGQASMGASGGGAARRR